MAGSKDLANHFFHHSLSLFHLSTENVRVHSVRNGHQCAYSRTGTINNITNKRSNVFSYEENTNKTIALNEILQGSHGFMLKCTFGLTAHRLETFILFCSLFLLGRSGVVPYSFVALLVAALLSE